MPFKFCESHIEQYRTHGYTVFRKIVPASLLQDLRSTLPRVKELIREGGPTGLRLQPLIKADINHKPYYDWMNLPDLNHAVSRTLSSQHRVAGGDLSRTGILIEPSDHPWCTQWHRDIHEKTPGLDPADFRKVKGNPVFFTQINSPILEDGSFWFVPGSGPRDDKPGEKEAADRQLSWRTEFAENVIDEQREHHCLEYCENMPGSLRVWMDAGDFCIYNPIGWHLGNYLPYKPRMTIHDWAPQPDLVAWYDRRAKNRTKASKEPAAVAA